MRLGRHGELPADQAFFDDHVTKALNSISDIARACLLLRTIEQMESYRYGGTYFNGVSGWTSGEILLNP